MPHVLAILAGSMLWGLAWIPIKGLSAGGLSPLDTTLACYGAAALVLLPRSIWRRTAWWHRRWSMAAIAVTGACGNIAFVGAVANGEVSRVILLYYLSTGWSIIGGRLLLGESIDRRRWGSVVVVFAGAWLVLDGAALGTVALSQPDFLAILAGLAHATMNLLFRVAEDVPGGAKNAAMFAGTAVVAAVLVGSGMPTVGAGPGIWVAGAVFGIGWVMAADWLLQDGVSHLPATESSVLLVAELPFAIASAALFAGERLSAFEVAGGGLIVMAALNEVFGHSSPARRV